MRALVLSILVGVLASSSSIAGEASRDDAYLTGEYRLRRILALVRQMDGATWASP